MNGRHSDKLEKQCDRCSGNGGTSAVIIKLGHDWKNAVEVPIHKRGSK